MWLCSKSRRIKTEAPTYVKPPKIAAGKTVGVPDFVSVFGKLVKTINSVVVRKGRFTPSQLSCTLQLFTVVDHRRLSSIDIIYNLYTRGCERSLIACMLKLWSPKIACYDLVTRLSCQWADRIACSILWCLCSWMNGISTRMVLWCCVSLVGWFQLSSKTEVQSALTTISGSDRFVASKSCSCLIIPT